MISFRPHKLTLTKSAAQFNEEEGEYTASPETDVVTVPCRYEPNGQARVLPLPDGSNYVYSYTIYLDIDRTREIRYGDRIKLYDENGIQVGREFEVKGFHRSQLHETIYV